VSFSWPVIAHQHRDVVFPSMPVRAGLAQMEHDEPMCAREIQKLLWRAASRFGAATWRAGTADGEIIE
jgi:hypothetical protein